jgi:type I restriction-modification system DNA methylase subunit
MIQQQVIFGDRIYKQKLSNFSLDTIPDLTAKKKIIEKYIRALGSGRIERTKEESIQADFLNKFFGDILGYEYNDPYRWNLEKEYKSVTDGSKADGVLGFFSMTEKTKNADVRAVIELKDALTDLDRAQNRLGDKRTPVEQAFSYSSKAGGHCKWVIVSNFREIRLYHASDQSRYESFIVGDLASDEHLKRFFFLVQKDHLIAEKGESIIDTLYRERLEFEQTISKQFYNKYKAMRIELFDHLKQYNPGQDHLLLIAKAQKLLDRFIFVCFCEDSNLIPAYTLKKIKDILNQAFDFEPNKIWRQLKGLFHSINLGNPLMDINRFDGGLFKKDEELDALIIKDSILLKLIDFSDFDFASDLNVNILGHIFEQSLSDIEMIKAQIDNGYVLSAEEKYDLRKNGKRKKEGIFYTPEYITRYIVKEAIGRWLDDRKRELGFYDLPELTPRDMDSIKRVRRKSKQDGKMYETLEYNREIGQHLAFWEAYQERLRNIKVLDPACGSGAFLNQAFDYLLEEGRKVNDEISHLKLGHREIFELDRHVLTKNLYGVDLNVESVEITRLSLWLKTARRDKELTALDENIKCGNSLIDDPVVAGSRAFDWSVNFPRVFPGPGEGNEGAGFDVVIGNPPYVFAREKINEAEKNYYTRNYSTAQYQVNTYILFIERTLELLKNLGYMGLIVPNAWLMVSSAKNLREILLTQSKICEIVNLAGYSFEGVNVETIILNAKKEKVAANTLDVKLSSSYDFVFSHTRKQEEFLDNNGFEFKVFSDENSDRIFQKITQDSVILDEVATVRTGLKAYQAGKGNPKQTPGVVKNRPFDFTHKFDANTHKYIEGKNVSRYHIGWSGSYLKFGNHLAEPRIFPGPKIIVREITSHLPNSIIASYTEELLLFNISNIAIIEKPGSTVSLKYLLGILNSSLMSYYFMKNTPKAVRQMFPKIILRDLRVFPIRVTGNQQPLIAKVDFMLQENNRLQKVAEGFIRLLQNKWPNLDITARIAGWYTLSFEDFRLALEKQKIRLTLAEQAEWLSYFNEQKHQAEKIHAGLSKTDDEINNMVYGLYGLTDEEIAMIEKDWRSGENEYVNT